MSARSISRLARTGFAAGALTVALSVPALAAPARDSSGAAIPGAAGVTPTPNASGNTTSGTDVAAPDQQSPIPTRSTLIVTPSPAPHNVSASPSGSFQWDDAGIGAGGALVIALTALGGVWMVRRRHGDGPPLAA